MTKPKERGILFNGDMVRALLDGRKTQTRRIVDPQQNCPCAWMSSDDDDTACFGSRRQANHDIGDMSGDVKVKSPYGNVGDLLKVREVYYQQGSWEEVLGVHTKTGRQKWRFVPSSDVIRFEPPGEYRKGRHHKDPYAIAWHKRLGRFMPLSISRITLETTGVRVERLQDITEEDAVAEGCERELVLDLSIGWGLWLTTARENFEKLWESINGPGSWSSNPWVWVYEFKQTGVQNG